MFGFVSKKAYDELEEQYREAKSNWRAECYAKIFDKGAYDRLQSIVIELRNENTSLKEEITKWKQMYADEVQKRIEITELMKNQ